MKRITIFGIVFSLIMLGIYGGEAYSLVNLVIHNADPVNNGFITACKLLVATYPWWWLLCTFGMVISGVLAPILYFFKNSHCIECADSAFGLNVLLIILNIIFRFRWTVFGSHTFITALVLAIITLVYAWYLNSRRETVYHSSVTGWKFLGSK